MLYFIASYLRLYVNVHAINGQRLLVLTVICVLLSWVSVIDVYYKNVMTGSTYYPYLYVSDSNKLLALITAVVSFMFFLNVNLKYHKSINTIAASTYGVLMIHANSDLMRQWLWYDTCRNTAFYDSPYLMIHALVTVGLVYVLCTAIDYLRIQWIEKPLFRRF